MFLFSAGHWILLRLPPEMAHRVGMWGLKLYQKFLPLFRKRVFSRGRVLVLKGAPTLALRGRVGLAAGFDKNAEAYAALLGLGFGFLEVGTVTPEPQPGNAKPRVWRVPSESLINHLGFNSEGLDVFLQNIRRLKSLAPQGNLLANIGKNKTTPEENALDDYRKGFEALHRDVDGFVVNLSSPNTPGLRNLQSEEFLSQLASIAPKEKPVLIKFAPDLENAQLQRLCEAVRAERAFAGVVVTNTSRAIAQSKYQREMGGYSGPLLFDRSLECVSVARQALGTSKILIGVGGVNSVERAKQMLEAGADLIEIYTAFVYQGPNLVRELSRIS